MQESGTLSGQGEQAREDAEEEMGNDTKKLDSQERKKRHEEEGRNEKEKREKQRQKDQGGRVGQGSETHEAEATRNSKNDRRRTSTRAARTGDSSEGAAWEWEGARRVSSKEENTGTKWTRIEERRRKERNRSRSRVRSNES